MTETQKIVIIGGVAAGPKICAKLLRTKDFNCKIDLYTEEDMISYSACGLPYFIEGLIEDVNRLIVRTPQQFEEKGANIHLNKRCTKILPQEHKIVIADTKTGIIDVFYHNVNDSSSDKFLKYKDKTMFPWFAGADEKLFSKRIKNMNSSELDNIKKLLYKYIPEFFAEIKLLNPAGSLKKV